MATNRAAVFRRPLASVRRKRDVAFSQQRQVRGSAAGMQEEGDDLDDLFAIGGRASGYSLIAKPFCRGHCFRGAGRNPLAEAGWSAVPGLQKKW